MFQKLFSLSIFDRTVCSFSVNLKMEIRRLKYQRDHLKPFELWPGVTVVCVPIFSQADQKAENAKNDNDCTSKCPKIGCFKLNSEFRECGQDPIIVDGHITAQDLYDIVFSLLHYDINMIKALNRLACLKYMNFMIGNGEYCFKKAEFAHWFEYKMDRIVEAYLNRGDDFKKVLIGFVLPDGGTSDTVSIC